MTKDIWRPGQPEQSLPVLLYRVHPLLTKRFPYLSRIGINISNEQEYPQLKYSGGIWEYPSPAHPHSRIVLNGGEMYQYQSIIKERGRSITLKAQKYNVDPNWLLKPYVFALFTIFHEFGHADDFIRNYQLNRQLSNPVQRFIQRRQQEMSTLPIPHKTPSEIKDLLVSGILGQSFIDPEAILEKQEVAYMELSTEVNANTFGFERLQEFRDFISM